MQVDAMASRLLSDQSVHDELVPGGFIFYNLMTFCPGIPLDRFRQKPFEEREAIREAFRVAYEYASFHLVPFPFFASMPLFIGSKLSHG